MGWESWVSPSNLYILGRQLMCSMIHRVTPDQWGHPRWSPTRGALAMAFVLGLTVED